MVIIKLVKYIALRFIRNLYWLVRLSKIKGISSVQLFFPIICEGKGMISLGKNTILNKYTALRIETNSRLEIQDDALIGKGSEITVTQNSELLIKSGVQIKNNTVITTSKNSIIEEGTFIASNVSIFSRESIVGSIHIGRDCGIGDFTIIDLSNDVLIEEGVAIGPRCTLYTHDHDYTNKNLPAWKGAIKEGIIHIKSGAWIGSNVTLLPNITIGKGAIIAAGSIVNKNVNDYQIWGGVPAKLIKTR